MVDRNEWNLGMVHPVRWVYNEGALMHTLFNSELEAFFSIVPERKN